MALINTQPIFQQARIPVPVRHLLLIDWHNISGQNFVTPVKNQGGCGSCVAFGAVAAVESKVKILRGASYAIDLSEAHLFYCIAGA